MFAVSNNEQMILTFFWPATLFAVNNEQVLNLGLDEKTFILGNKNFSKLIMGNFFPKKFFLFNFFSNYHLKLFIDQLVFWRSIRSPSHSFESHPTLISNEIINVEYEGDLYCIRTCSPNDYRASPSHVETLHPICYFYSNIIIKVYDIKA